MRNTIRCLRRLPLVGLLALALSCSCKSAESEDSNVPGPTLANIPDDQGIIVLRFDDGPEDAKVSINQRSSGFYFHQESFPVRVAAPLGSVELTAYAPDYRAHEETIILDRKNRRKEVVIRLSDDISPSVSLGFSLAEIRKVESGFIPLLPRTAGQPAEPLFDSTSRSMRNSRHRHRDEPAIWNTYSTMIDSLGEVWVTVPQPDGSDPFARIGRIDPEVLDRMVALRKEAISGDIVTLANCGEGPPFERNSLGVYTDGPKGSERVEIGAGGRVCELRRNGAARTVALWLYAVRFHKPKAK